MQAYRGKSRADPRRVPPSGGEGGCWFLAVGCIPLAQNWTLCFVPNLYLIINIRRRGLKTSVNTDSFIKIFRHLLSYAGQLNLCIPGKRHKRTAVFSFLLASRNPARQQKGKCRFHESVLYSILQPLFHSGRDTL